MADVINLRRARKAKQRDGRAVEAQANRALYGRTKAEKTRDDADRARIARTVDQARLERKADS
jgi:hypothetical protein